MTRLVDVFHPSYGDSYVVYENKRYEIFYEKAKNREARKYIRIEGLFYWVSYLHDGLYQIDLSKGEKKTACPHCNFII